MIDRIVLDIAYRNLTDVAGLADDEFWRAYARVEDAALLCTEPEDHGAIVQALNACLVRLGKVQELVGGSPSPDEDAASVSLA